MKVLDPQKIRDEVLVHMPKGSVIPEHTDKAHFYRVMDPELGNPKYPSVTGKLQIVKDPSIANFKMNRAVEYFFSHFDQMNQDNLMEHLDNARSEGDAIFRDAGDVGTDIHDIRELYMNEWIETGKKPDDILSFIPEVKEDTRIISALRGLEKFINDFHYTPIFCELLVYSHKMKVAGTLDDLGIMRWPVGRGKTLKSWYGKQWDEATVTYNKEKNVGIELSTGEKFRYVLVLSDLKTSNQFKPHYFFQVSMYYDFLKEITGIRCDKAIIVKADKNKQTYQIEDLKQPAKLAQYSKSVFRVDHALDFISDLRKDNQTKVVPLK